ncbi:hypothetical protein PDN28_14130 [Bacillus cereus]|uniref:hypothetical protein n=1 Tax=Bacillus cereus group sp. MYBK215-2 TaxID=3450664 RepID=UPI0024096316|nr:hypothetical protein [Bacillus cereus]MDA2267040.1 hypothetical protein [Bacillus cereus]MDC7777819.1 hypothetical protein [Bacillus cereus]
MKEKDANVGGIFPLSPIPLLIHLGSLLTDTVPYPIYQFNRETGLWVSDNPGTNKDIILTCSKDVKDSAELVSISGKVKKMILSTKALVFLLNFINFSKNM